MRAPAISWIGNTRPGLDRNTCGQAAIATVLRAWRLAGEDLEDGAAIDGVRAVFPPDLPFGLGTSAFRIAAALSAHGLEVELVHSGWFGARRALALDRLLAHVGQGLPAPVCLNGRDVGGSRWSAHWAVALGVEASGVLVGNAGPGLVWPLHRFVDAWACRHLPFSHNHCAVLARLRGAAPATAPGTHA